jgi:hypothetical protein
MVPGLILLPRQSQGLPADTLVICFLLATETISS